MSADGHRDRPADSSGRNRRLGCLQDSARLEITGRTGGTAAAGSAPLLGPAGSLAAASQLALARQLGLPGFGLLLAGLSIVVVPSGSAGVRVNQFVGTRPKTLYPGVYFIIPLIENLETYNLKDTVFATSIPEGLPNGKDDAHARVESLRVQTREGALVNLVVAVRYRIDPSKLAYINANVPQPIEE